MTDERKTALIFGISGQDGAYLAKLLLERNYTVHGTSRDAEISAFPSLAALGIKEQIGLHSAVPTDFRSTFQVISRTNPDEIYNLSGQSSVGLSFQQPVETLESITVGTLNILECIRLLARPIKFYNAGSSECFGDTGGKPANESTPFHPCSPYAVAKSAAFWEVANYRDSYGLYACSGILFNHESPLRPQRFVTRKVTAAAIRIANGSNEQLVLGDLAIRRDWGWAPEYVEAMWAMLQQEKPEDFVIATGVAHSLEEFVDAAFTALDLNWRDHVRTDASLFRPSEIRCGFGNAAKAATSLGWKARTLMPEVVRRMVEAEVAALAAAQGHQTHA
ncbi:MAG: GDP-mannose 4,6-dehydratase [Sulfuritalea sp.]|nr:GDP-mannose 4,6-dehydratase [Sulfuritalea sp.]